MTTKIAGQMIYLVENLSDARLRCDQLKRYLAKAMKLVEKSSKRDQFYEVAGDILNGVPDVIMKMDKALDATALAASRLDYEELKQQLSPEKVEELEEVLKDVRVKHLERRSLPKETNVTFKAASSNHLSEAILRVASGIEDASLHPREASNRLAFIRMALSQTAQQAVESMGPIQADSEEAVRDGFLKANPKLSEGDLDSIVKSWRDNKDVVKDQHKTAAKREQLDPSKALEGAAVAFFYVGGDENEGDPESVTLQKGDVPLKAVEKYLERRLGDGAQVSIQGSKLTCKAKGYDGKPYSYSTPVKVEARASKKASFPAAPQAHVAEALRRIASEVQSCKIAPQDAWTRLAFVRMALSQTAQQAVEAFGSIQADSREKVMDGFKKSNPALSADQLEEIADHWESNQNVVKDRHKTAGPPRPIGPREPALAGQFRKILSDLESATQEYERKTSVLKANLLEVSDSAMFLLDKSKDNPLDPSVAAEHLALAQLVHSSLTEATDYMPDESGSRLRVRLKRSKDLLKYYEAL